MTADSDPDAPAPTTPEPALMDSHSTQELAFEMASVAGAMFGLLQPHRLPGLTLLRTPPPEPAEGAPAGPPAGAPPASASPPVPVPGVPAPPPAAAPVVPPAAPAAVPLPEVVPEDVPVPAPVAARVAVPVPTSVPVPGVLPESHTAAHEGARDDPPQHEATSERPPTARERRSMALLNEIAFLDE